MNIIVLSCSKNEDTFKPFHVLMERYYSNHPDIVYFTDMDRMVMNPYYDSIPVWNELSTWTKGFRQFLKKIKDEHVLLMIDDCFIRRPVDVERIEEAESIMAAEPNIACMNFELSWDENDEETDYIGWKKRKHGSRFEVSLMCGLWNREKLLKVVDRDCTPWEIEENQDGKGFDYYINSGDYIIDWGYKTFHPVGKVKGKWTEETLNFLKKEGLM